MALGREFVSGHIAKWETLLDGGYRPYRKHWPCCVFHHAPIENAAILLRDGHIRSRNDPGNARSRDVAGAGVIDNVVDSHNLVRLYFRPRTPTQYHIEGIRKDGECQFGENAHAPILIMFVLDASKVLTRADVSFSDRNMQRSDRLIGDTEAFFSSIPFDKVYHEGGISGDQTIIFHRCAEVLSQSPLPLNQLLKGIWFRSEPERDTLFDMLGSEHRKWMAYCHVSEELKIFDKNYTFVSEVSLTTEGVVFKLNNRSDLANVDLKIEISDHHLTRIIDFQHSDYPTSSRNGNRWIYKKQLAEGTYRVRVTLEGHLAFEGNIALENSLF